jgi:hypothetical protein
VRPTRPTAPYRDSRKPCVAGSGFRATDAAANWRIRGASARAQVPARRAQTRTRRCDARWRRTRARVELGLVEASKRSGSNSREALALLYAESEASRRAGKSVLGRPPHPLAAYVSPAAMATQAEAIRRFADGQEGGWYALLREIAAPAFVANGDHDRIVSRDRFRGSRTRDSTQSAGHLSRQRPRIPVSVL